MNAHGSTQAEDTAAILEDAAHGGVPVLIPGAFEVRVGRPAAPPTTAKWVMPHAHAAVVYDRERLEREREGGGAPSERTGGRHKTILGTLWQAAVNTCRT